MKKSYICTSCGYVGQSTKTITKGNFLMEVVLWFFFLIPGLIYSLWRLTSKTKGCWNCKNQTMVPVDSPMGKKLMAELNQHEKLNKNL